MALTPKQQAKKPSANNAKTTVGKPFKPGQSGNPSGRPKIPQEFKDLAKEHSISALKKVIFIMESGISDHKDQLRAAEIIMDRAWGKATQGMELSGPEGAPIEIATAAERQARINELIAKRTN